MCFGFPLQNQILPPPPPPDSPYFEECDRFGWSLHSCLLRDSAATRLIKREMVIELVTDAFRTAERELGRAEAKRLFHEVTKDPKKGKQSSELVTNAMLRVYDVFLRFMPNKKKQIPRMIAERIKKYPHKYRTLGPVFQSVDAMIKRIRHAVQDREEKRQRLAALPSFGIAGATSLKLRPRQFPKKGYID